MKKERALRRLMLVSFLVLTVNDFNVAESYFFNHEIAFTVTDGVNLLVVDEVATLFMGLPGCDRWCWQEFRKEDLEYGRDGYARLSLFDRKLNVILGGNHLFLEVPSYPAMSMYVPEVEKPGGQYGRTVYNFRVRNVVPSSIFQETLNGVTIVYNADGVMNRFMEDSMGIELLWNHHSRPWVEGAEGAGIGETLDIEFSEAMDHMLILNGFVDPGRKYLFKANSRVKKARIRSLDPAVDFSFEYEFEDKVQFSYIPFPKRSGRVQFEILEAYPGERWQDTSISGVLTNHQWDQFSRGTIQSMKTPEHRYK